MTQQPDEDEDDAWAAESPVEAATLDPPKLEPPALDVANDGFGDDDDFGTSADADFGDGGFDNDGFDDFGDSFAEPTTEDFGDFDDFDEGFNLPAAAPAPAPAAVERTWVSEASLSTTDNSTRYPYARCRRGVS